MTMTWQPQEVPGVAVLAARPCWAGFALLPRRASWSQAGQGCLVNQKKCRAREKVFLGCIRPSKEHQGELQGSCHTAGQSALLCDGDFPPSKCFQCSGPPWCGQPACFGRGCALPAGPVLSPVPLLLAAQLGVSPWAAAGLVPDISNGPIMPDVFTAFERK